MAVVKIKKRESSFVQIEKSGIEESGLSWAATGLLTYLIGRPDCWEINVQHLAGVKTDRRDATRGALNELRKYGYCHYFEIREKGKIIDTTYLIFEIPTPASEAKDMIQAEEGQTVVYKSHKEKSEEKKHIQPETGLPETAQPFTENPTLLIIDNNNKENNNKRTTTEKSKKEISEDSSSSLEFLDEKEYSRINSKTKANIKNNFPELTKTRFVEIFNFVVSREKKGKIENFDGALYSALKEKWIVEKTGTTQDSINLESAEKGARHRCNMALIDLETGIYKVPEIYESWFNDKFSLKIKNQHPETFFKYERAFWKQVNGNG